MSAAKTPRLKKRPRGRPKVGSQFPIQKHIFLDHATAEKLAEDAGAVSLSESAFVRQLIREHRASPN